MPYIVPYLHRRRVNNIFGIVGDPTLTLHYNYLLDSGSTIAQSVVIGPTPTYTGNGGTSMIWDENATLVSTTNNQPRYDHDPVTGAARGILPEEARTNLQINSEAIDGGGWSKNNLTVNANDIAAPDGNSTADRVTDNSSNGKHNIHDAIALAGDTFCAFSIFGKAGTKDFIYVNYATGAVDEQHVTAVFNLDSGTVSETEVGTTSGTIALTAIEDAGGGWYRGIMVGKQDAANDFFQPGMAEAATGNSFTADGLPAYVGTSQTAYFWGVQAEVGDVPTSYIPTTTSTVTRTADVLSATITSILGAANTLFVSGRTGYGAGVVCQIDDGTENERYRIERNASNELRLYVTDGGVEQVGASGLNLGTVADKTDFKLAIRLEANNFASSLDGAAVVTDASGSLPTVTTLREGRDTTGNYWNSTRSVTKLWNVGKSNAVLVTETT